MSMIARTAALVAALVLDAPAAMAQQKTVWRYAHVGAEGESQTRYAAELARLVTEKTQGRIEIRVFPGSQLGNLSEMIDGRLKGSHCAGSWAVSCLSGLLPGLAHRAAPSPLSDRACRSLQ